MAPQKLSPLGNILITIIVIISPFVVDCIHNGNQTTNALPFNVSYVLLPADLRIGLLNRILVQTKQSRTLLHITLNLTRMNIIFKDDKVYELNETTDGDVYARQIDYIPPVYHDLDESIPVKMHFNFTHCLDDSCTTSISKVVIEMTRLVKSQPLIMGETDKPIYAPGQLVRARFLALDPLQMEPSLMVPLDKLPRQKIVVDTSEKYTLASISETELMQTRTLNYDEIYITDPNADRLAQWSNVNKSLASNLHYTLLNDTVEGAWTIHAKLQSIEETIVFDVRRYSLPRFTIDVKPPENLTRDSQAAEYTVCAKYTNGPPMKGFVNSMLCTCSEYIWNREYDTDKSMVLDNVFAKHTCPSSKYDTMTGRRCVATTSELLADGCARFNVSTELLELKNNKYSNWDEITLVCARVVEEGTNSEVSSCVQGSRVQSRKVSVDIRIHEVYKPNLPFVGTFKLNGAEYLTAKQKQLRVLLYESTSGYYWRGPTLGRLHFNRTVQVDGASGLVEVKFPPIDSFSSLKLKAVLINSSNDGTPVGKMQYPTSYDEKPDEVSEITHLTAWKTIDKINLQLWPPVASIDAKCPGTVHLNLMANTPLWNKTIYVEGMVKGKHLFITIPPTDVEDQCMDLDNELGHYECGDKANGNEIKCLPGWTGNDCLEAICSESCNKTGGGCTTPNECVCNVGWRGSSCDICVKRDGCVHGRCVNGDDCVCEAEWSGYLCDKRRVVYDKIEKQPNTKDGCDEPDDVYLDSNSGCQGKKESIPIVKGGEAVKRTPRRTLHTRSIEFSINSEWGPKSPIVIYFHLDDGGNNSNIGENINNNNANNSVGGDGNTGTKSIMVTTFLTIDIVGNCASKAMELQTMKSDKGMQFTRYELSPGEKVNLKIEPAGLSGQHTTDSNQMDEVCYLSISDISLENFDDKMTRWTLQYFTDKLTRYISDDYHYYSQPVTNEQAFQRAGLQMGSSYPQITVMIPEPRFVYYSVSEAGPMPYSSNSGISKQASRITKPRLRDFFPEVWLFETLPVKEILTSKKQLVRGINLNLTAPDSVTSWRASALCTTKTNGIWIPDSQLVTVSMPFYIDITIPKESKRDEILHLPVSVFMSERQVDNTSTNPMKDCYEISVTSDLDSAEWIYQGSTSFTDCLCVGDKRTYPLTIIPRKVGNLNVTVHAVANPNSPMCNNPDTTDVLFKPNTKLDSKVFSDRIRRSIQVLPEGIRTEVNVGEILCVEKGDSVAVESFPLFLPEDAIKDSVHTYLSYSREVLGSTMKNLDNLVKLPRGCGEQNMVLVAPNVFVFAYLKAMGMASSKSSELLISTVRRHIESGYRQQMKYQRADGSFSAFGKSDREGSVWLTAFVLRVFSQAHTVEPTLSIPWEELFNSSYGYLAGKQNTETGCFVESGTLFDRSMQGSLNADRRGNNDDSGEQIVFTSYVASALKEASVLGNRFNVSGIGRVIDKCTKCIVDKLRAMGDDVNGVLRGMHTYAIVQLAHGLITIDPGNELTKVLWSHVVERKRQAARQADWKNYWSGYAKNTTTSERNERDSTGSATAQDVEATAYAYLTYSKMNSTVQSLLPIIRWLTSNQNANGGFYSTQDTVLGLEALADFATKLGLSTTNAQDALTIEASISDANYKLVGEIVAYERELVHRHELPSYTPGHKSAIQWKLKSNGAARHCVAVQTTFVYNLPTVNGTAKKPSFTIATALEQSMRMTGEACKIANLTICVKPTQQTGMLLMQVAMVTGWEPIVQALNSQLGSGAASLRRYEVDASNSLALYFDGFAVDRHSELGLDAQRRCVEISMRQVLYIENAENATIKVQDYYVPETSITHTYELSDCRNSWSVNSRPNPTAENVTPVDTMTTTAMPVSVKLVPQVVCPDCLHTTEKLDSLQALTLKGSCQSLYAVYVVNVTKVNGSYLDATLFELSSSAYVASWNTTIDLTGLVNCTCDLIVQKKPLILLSNVEYLDLYPGDAVVNLGLLSKDVKLISSELLLPKLDSLSLQLTTEHKDDNAETWSNCRRLMKLAKLLKTKFAPSNRP